MCGAHDGDTSEVIATLEVSESFPNRKRRTSRVSTVDLSRDDRERVWRGRLELPAAGGTPWYTFSQDGCEVRWVLDLAIYAPNTPQPERVRRELDVAIDPLPPLAGEK
jgi:hypothetical protein